MSTSRDSNFYYEIQDALKKGLKAEGYEVPEEIIKGALAALFDSVAIHVWSRPDVYRVAWEAGWPISPTMADEILADVEAHADSEYGITWLTFENAVEEFYDDFEWGRMTIEDQDVCMGSFLTCYDPPDSPQAAETMLYLDSTSLGEALDEASDMAANSGLAVSGYSIPKDTEPSLDAAWLETHAHKLWTFYAKEERPHQG